MDFGKKWNLLAFWVTHREKCDEWGRMENYAMTYSDDIFGDFVQNSEGRLRKKNIEVKNHEDYLGFYKSRIRTF